MTKQIIKKVYECYLVEKHYHEEDIPVFQLKILGLKRGIFGGWTANAITKMVLPKYDGSVKIIIERVVLMKSEKMEKDIYSEGFKHGYDLAIQDLQSLIEASIKTINENLHLCDGEVCTLKELRNAVISLPEPIKNRISLKCEY